MAVIIKTPPVYDLSKWEIVTDWAGLSPKPALIILRATYGSGLVDALYAQYYRDAKAAGYPVWAYHFFRYLNNWQTQTDLFLTTVKAAGTPPDFVPVLDIEGALPTGMTVGTANGMIENSLSKIEAELGRACYIYSSKNYLSALYATNPPAWLSAPWRLKWIAGYPLEPNQFSDMPNAYLPVGIPASQVALWQYSDKGVVAGITGAVDLNDMTDWYEAQWNTPPIPSEPSDEEKLRRLWDAHPELW